MNILQKFFTRSYFRENERRILVILTPLFAITAFIAALLIGSTDVSLSEAIRSLVESDRTSAAYRIIFHIRLPRALGGLFAGAALAVSGVILQAVLGNPMAAPNIIGVNSGAGFFVILTMAAIPAFAGYVSLAAFIGAFLAALLIYAISRLSGAGRVTITLIGVAVGSILTAGINTVKTLFPDSVYDVSGFLIGGLSAVSTAKVLPALAMIIPALMLAIIFSPSLDVLSLGEQVARGLGVPVGRARLLWILLAAILAGAAVSYSGLIGFIGLIIPHVMRSFVGNSHKYLIPVSTFSGGAFLLVMDTAARTLFAPYELPVGILLSLIGGPFFILLILLERRCGR